MFCQIHIDGIELFTGVRGLVLKEGFRCQIEIYLGEIDKWQNSGVYGWPPVLHIHLNRFVRMQEDLL